MGFLKKKSKMGRSSKQLATIEEIQKTPPFRHIQVSVSAFLQSISDKSPMDLSIPHFILHDFPDGEESKAIRMILSAARIPFETKAIHRDEYILEDYPFYSLPMLEINEKKLGSVPSICRQLGWRYEFSGMNAGEDSETDMIGEKIFETRMRLKNFLDHIEHREDHDCDASCSVNVISPYITSLCQMLETILKESKSPWFVAHKMTWADVLSACLFSPLIYHFPLLFNPFPNVYLHTKKISELEEFTGFLYHLKDRPLQ